MSVPVNNPPAFPRTGDGFGNPKYDTPGMSLRDYFAGQFIVGHGYVVESGELTREAQARLAKEAYQVADAMLRAREELK